MILGQLIQAGKQFCEYRTRDFLPESDYHHTFLAYNVMDLIDVKTFESDEMQYHDAVSKWLQESASIAYIIISRNFDNKQQELPVPIGFASVKNITITAATSSMIGQMNFLTLGNFKEPPFKLISNREARLHRTFLLRNHLKITSKEEPEPVCDLGQFTLPNLVEPSLSAY